MTGLNWRRGENPPMETGLDRTYLAIVRVPFSPDRVDFIYEIIKYTERGWTIRKEDQVIAWCPLGLKLMEAVINGLEKKAKA